MSVYVKTLSSENHPRSGTFVTSPAKLLVALVVPRGEDDEIPDSG